MDQWQQWIGLGTGLLALTGLSATPWIAALLWGRLLTLRQHEGRVTDLKEQADKAEARAAKAEELRTIEYNRAESERKRADEATAKLAEVGQAYGSRLVAVMEQLAAASDDGGDDGGKR